jgi:antitoxin ParD1/3/4
MSIAVPISMKKQIVSRVKAGGYGNVSEYLRELIRHDPETRHKYIEERLLEGVRSGPEIEATGEFWEKLRRISKFAAAESKKTT